MMVDGGGGGGGKGLEREEVGWERKTEEWWSLRWKEGREGRRGELRSFRSLGKQTLRWQSRRWSHLR